MLPSPSIDSPWLPMVNFAKLFSHPGPAATWFSPAHQSSCSCPPVAAVVSRLAPGPWRTRLGDLGAGRAGPSTSVSPQHKMHANDHRCLKWWIYDLYWFVMICCISGMPIVFPQIMDLVSIHGLRAIVLWHPYNMHHMRSLRVTRQTITMQSLSAFHGQALLQLLHHLS